MSLQFVTKSCQIVRMFFSKLRKTAQNVRIQPASVRQFVTKSCQIVRIFFFNCKMSEFIIQMSENITELNIIHLQPRLQWMSEVNPHASENTQPAAWFRTPIKAFFHTLLRTLIFFCCYFLIASWVSSI